jgi:hypothetical protein
MEQDVGVEVQTQDEPEHHVKAMRKRLAPRTAWIIVLAALSAW